MDQDTLKTVSGDHDAPIGSSRMLAKTLDKFAPGLSIVRYQLATPAAQLGIRGVTGPRGPEVEPRTPWEMSFFELSKNAGS